MKKLLALVLALVMVLGLATVGASAADFKDNSSIEYAEAVAVMNGIGVIQGDDNGNFNPKGTLTREQAAKIVAYMLLGKSGADSLSAAGAPFDDVAADRWSAGAISYCANEGIIAGLGNGQFNPEGKLTGHQFAKMLLVALGYDAKLEGMQGTADWAVNVAKLAVSANLEEDLSIVMSQEITRDQAAMMAFNTLKSDMVDYENGVNVKTSDGTDVTVNAKRYKVDDMRGDEYDKRAVVAGTPDTDKFCEVYFKDLKLDDTGDNDFMEPMNKWVFKNVTICETAKKAEKVLTGSVTYQDVYNAAGSAAMNSVDDIYVYVDGSLIDSDTGNGGAKSNTLPTHAAGKTWSKDNDKDLGWNPCGGAAPASALGNPTGNGTITSVFVTRQVGTPDTYIINVNIKHVYVGKVVSVDTGSPRKVTISAKTTPSTTLTGVTLDNDFETENFKKDDIVLYTVAVSAGEAKIQSMELATLVSGVEVSKTSSEKENATTYKPNKSVVTAGGKDYKLNINAKVENKNDTTVIEEFSAGDKFDLYLDNNGLIVWAEKTEEELNLSNYLVLTRGNMSAGTGANPVADAVKLDGTKLTNINVTKYDGNSISNWSSIELFKIYKFVVKGSDYELKPVTGSYSALRQANINYTTGTATLTGKTATGATKLYVYDLSDSGLKTYTGVNNFPNVTQTVGNPGIATTTKGGEYLASVENTGAGTNTNQTAINGNGYQNLLDTTTANLGAANNALLSTTYTNAVATLCKNGNVVAAVLVHNTWKVGTTVYSNVSTSVSAEDIVYVTGKSYTSTKDGDDNVYTFDAIKDGKVTTISTKNETVRDLLAADQRLLKIDAYDGSYVDGVTAFSGTVAAPAVAAGTTSWGRTTIAKPGTPAPTIAIGVGGIYSVSVDVTSGTFKMETNDANGDGTNYAAWSTSSKTKFYEISSKGVVTEKEASDFSYDNLIEGEFSVVIDTNDNNTATFIFYQKV